MGMTEVFAVILLGLAFAAVLFYHAVESAAWRDERSRLLDRIMARNYTDFVYAKSPETVETPQLLTDEAEAAWHAENMKLHPELYPDEGE